MMAASVLVVVGAGMLARVLAGHLGSWNAAVVAALAGTGAVSISYVLLPGVDETPAGFPAGDLWEFRLASIGMQLTAWAAIGLSFGALTDRALRRTPGVTHARPTHPPLSLPASRIFS